MNTSSATAAASATTTTPAANTPARLSALALAAVMTLAMLGSVNTLARPDAAAPQMARTVSTSHA